MLVGQGGTSGGLFSLAAQTWISQNPGPHTIVNVSTGQQAIQAMEAYVAAHGSIDGMQVFSHSSNYAIFFNQGAGANSLYINMPGTPGSGATTINDINSSWFNSSANVKLWGCYTGSGADSFAQELANQIGVDVIGSLGSTGFTGVPNGTPGQGLPTPVPVNYTPVYMVPENPSRGYTSFSPQRGWFNSILRFFGF